MLNEIIASAASTDDLLKAIGHDDDIRRQMSDAEIITTALIAAIFFNGNHSKACAYMKDHNLIPKMLEKSRFNRRLHNVSMLINDLFHQIGMILKESSDSTEYLLDSFPVAMCNCSHLQREVNQVRRVIRLHCVQKKILLWGQSSVINDQDWCTCGICVYAW